MRVIIPAAGEGTRLRPHTYTVPKALIPVAGKPMIAHILDHVRDLKPTEVSIVVGFLGEQIVDHFRDRDPLPFRFFYQAERKGLGHAIWQVLKDDRDEETLIVLGDSIIDADYGGAIASSESLIGVKEVDDPRRFGIVEVEMGFVTRLVEKPEEPASNLAIVGLYYFPSTEKLRGALRTMIEKDIRTKGEYQLTDALQILIDKGERMRPLPIEGWFDCGKPETLLATQRHLLDKHGGFNEAVAGCVIRPPVHLSAHATIEGSIIGPYVTVEDRVVITGSIVSDSIICQGAELVQCHVIGSIVGSDAKVKGQGARLNIGQEAEFYLS